MSIHVSSRVWAIGGLSPRDKLVALALADFADEKGQHVFPSVVRVAGMTGLDRRTVQRAMRYLQQAGAIARVSRGGGRAMGTRSGDTAEYRFVQEWLNGGTVPQRQAAAVKHTAAESPLRAAESPLRAAESPFKGGTVPPDPSYIRHVSVKEPPRADARSSDVSDRPPGEDAGGSPEFRKRWTAWSEELRQHTVQHKDRSLRQLAEDHMIHLFWERCRETARAAT